MINSESDIYVNINVEGSKKDFFKKRLSLEKDNVELKGKSRISSILQSI